MDRGWMDVEVVEWEGGHIAGAEDNDAAKKAY